MKYPIKSEFMSDLELKIYQNLKYNGTWIDSQLAIYRLSDILERDILFIGFGKNYNRKKFKKKNLFIYYGMQMFTMIYMT